MVLNSKFYHQSTLKIARDLLGCFLATNIDGQITIGRIVDTEAYPLKDPASHAYAGKTVRNAAMFGLPGYTYVYQIYERYFCFNVVTGQKNDGQAVLIRAVEPVAGLEIMQQRRGQTHPAGLTNGPSKLTQALGIHKSHSNQSLLTGSVRILAPDSFGQPRKFKISSRPRIGISKATQKPYRFCILGNKFVSKK